MSSPSGSSAALDGSAQRYQLDARSCHAQECTHARVLEAIEKTRQREPAFRWDPAYASPRLQTNGTGPSPRPPWIQD